MIALRAIRLSLLLLVTCCAVAQAQTVDPRDSNYALNEDGRMPPYVVPVLRLVTNQQPSAQVRRLWLQTVLP